MPSNLEPTEFLSHIDPPLEPSNREAILSQIRAELAPEASSTLYPSIPSQYEPQFSDLMTAEIERVGTKAPRPEGTGIDLSRYEASALEAPSNTSPNSDEKSPELLAKWRETLQRAYGLNTYLNGRVTNLSLLETYGKNAWLIGNSQLEDELRALEAELRELKQQNELVEEERRRRQEGVKGEMVGLEESWRKGVRGVVDVEVATESLRQEVLERRRAGASVG